VTMCVKDANVPGHVGKKVYICHGGTTSEQNISTNAVQSHLASGDQLGACNNQCGVAARGMNTTDTSSTTSQAGTTGIDITLTSTDKIKVYPNPSGGIFNIEVPAVNKEAEIVITDITGRIVEKRMITDNKGKPATFDLSGFTEGIYFIRVNAGDKTYIDKLLKK